jgi:phage terminase large subunit
MPVVLRVLRPFGLCTPVGVRGSSERRFIRGEHVLDPENPEDAAVLAHPWIRDTYADGAIENPQQAADRNAREAAEAERQAAEGQRAQTHAAEVIQADTALLAQLDRAAEAVLLPPGESTPAKRPSAPPWKPDYAAIYAQRIERLRRLRADPRSVPAIRTFYAVNPAQFITDWGITADPRNALLTPPRPVLLPFILFPKQTECVAWILERAKAREPGLIEKSRDCGMSWLALSLAATLCLFNRNLNIGFASAKEDKVDRSGDPDCLFWKLRTFLKHLPPEFRGGWDESKHSAHMRINFPETGSAIVGEAGDNIGRGGRQSITFLDEAAHIERPELIDASLASTTDCRIDISSVNGMANSFAQRRHSGRIAVFTFHWRDDPRKGDEWYAKQKELLDPVTLAAEVDLDYRASVEGALIPSAWVQVAVGAAEKLGIVPTGAKRAGLDVADSGTDRNCFAARHGVVLYGLESWSGKNSDIYASVLRAFSLADRHGSEFVDFDGDGLGAGVRGDARTINDTRKADGRRLVHFALFRGSGSPFDPEGELVPGRKNKDFFANAKAAAWWHLRTRFQNTFRAVVDGLKVDPDQIISIDPELPELSQLLQQLTQPTYSLNAAGKVVVDKAPDGTPSPDRADAVMIAFQPSNRTLETWLRIGKQS